MLYGRGAVDMKGAIACAVAAGARSSRRARRQAEGLDLVPDHRRRGRHRRQRHREAPAMGGRARRELRPLHPRRAEQRRRARRHHQGRPARLAQRHAGGHRQAGPRRLSAARRQSGARAGHADERADGGAARPRQRAFRCRRTSNSPRSTSATPSVNLIPGEARARFNIRFNDCHSQTSLKTLIEQLRRATPPASACAGASTGSRRTPTCSSPSRARSSIWSSARSRR